MHSVLFIRLIDLEMHVPKVRPKAEKDLQFIVVERFSSLSYQMDKKSCCSDRHCQHYCNHKGNQLEDKVDTKDGRMERKIIQVHNKIREFRVWEVRWLLLLDLELSTTVFLLFK